MSALRQGANFLSKNPQVFRQAKKIPRPKGQGIFDLTTRWSGQQPARLSAGLTSAEDWQGSAF
jgi:hypothetical protein